MNQRRLRAARRLREGWPNPIPRARLYQQALPVEGSYGKVAKKFGVTREEVCHYVTLVKRLPPDVVAAVEAETNPMRCRPLSLRALLGIARLDDAERQRAAFGKLAREPSRSPSRGAATRGRQAAET